MRTLRFGPLFLLAAIVLSGLVTHAASPARSSDQVQPAAFIEFWRR